MLISLIPCSLSTWLCTYISTYLATSTSTSSKPTSRSPPAPTISSKYRIATSIGTTCGWSAAQLLDPNLHLLLCLVVCQCPDSNRSMRGPGHLHSLLLSVHYYFLFL
ncbi:hypothetical protein EV426DRAFT_31323 [Tirmania nivea]|nr:hypothetical protein EV426DRAFT_31323 [Tirmania nivea]